MVKNNILKKLSDTLSIPRDLVSDTSKLTLTGSEELSIEKHRGIIEFGNERIIVRCSGFDSVITGTELTLAVMDGYELRISGKIASVQVVM